MTDAAVVLLMIKKIWKKLMSHPYEAIDVDSLSGCSAFGVGVFWALVPLAKYRNIE